MVIDSSAIVAIVRLEAGYVELTKRIFEASPTIMAAPNALEVHMVLRKWFGEGTSRIVGTKFAELGINVVPFGPEHTTEATKAFDRYGKGNHPAALNFGDCIAYALAKVSGQPLLFVGDDFGKTDVRIA